MKRCLAESKQQKNAHNQSVTATLLFDLSLEENFLAAQIMPQMAVTIRDDCKKGRVQYSTLIFYKARFSADLYPASNESGTPLNDSIDRDDCGDHGVKMREALARIARNSGSMRGIYFVSGQCGIWELRSRAWRGN